MQHSTGQYDDLARDARFVDLNRRSSCAAQPKAPGTGLQSPETGRQNRRYRDLSRQQRPHVPHLNSRKRPQIAGYSSETGKHRFASVCVVVGAVRIERVSAAKFLSIREKNREFCKFKGSSTIGGRKIADVA